MKSVTDELPVTPTLPQSADYTKSNPDSEKLRDLGLLVNEAVVVWSQVCCHNAAPATTTGNLELTRKGVPEQLVAKTEGPGNHWVFEVTSDVYVRNQRIVKPALAMEASEMRDVRAW